MMNTNKLRAVMILNDDNGGDLAKYLGITHNRFSKKLNSNEAEFTQGEIMAIKEKYKLTANEVDDIFFNVKVSKKDTNVEQE